MWVKSEKSSGELGRLDALMDRELLQENESQSEFRPRPGWVPVPRGCESSRGLVHVVMGRRGSLDPHLCLKGVCGFYVTMTTMLIPRLLLESVMRYKKSGGSQ